MSANHAIYHTIRFVLLFAYTYFTHTDPHPHPHAHMSNNNKKWKILNSKNVWRKRILVFFLRSISSNTVECIFVSDLHIEISVSNPLSVHSLVLTPVKCICTMYVYLLVKMVVEWRLPVCLANFSYSCNQHSALLPVSFGCYTYLVPNEFQSSDIVFVSKRKTISLHTEYFVQ